MLLQNANGAIAEWWLSACRGSVVYVTTSVAASLVTLVRLQRNDRGVGGVGSVGRVFVGSVGGAVESGERRVEGGGGRWWW